MSLEQQPDNNPAGEPPAATPPAAPNVSQDILDVLSLNDTPATADQIASGEQPSPPAVAPAATAGEVSAQASPDTPPPAASPTPATPPPTTPASTPPAPAASEQPATPPPGLQVDEAALRTASLEAERDALRRELEALRASPQPGQPGQPAAQPSPEQPAAEQPKRYALTLPTELQNDLVGDDPAKTITAITTIVNDLGTILHNTVVAQLRGEFSGMLNQLAGAAQETQLNETRQTTAEQLKTAYYAAFPTHNNPLILPIIQAETQKMAAEFPGLSWNEQYQNALGARVNAALAAISGQPPAQPTAPATPPNQPPARPAPMLPTGNRGGQPTPAASTSDDIVDLLDPFSNG